MVVERKKNRAFGPRVRVAGAKGGTQLPHFTTSCAAGNSSPILTQVAIRLPAAIEAELIARSPFTRQEADRAVAVN